MARQIRPASQYAALDGSQRLYEEPSVSQATALPSGYVGVATTPAPAEASYAVPRGVHPVVKSRPSVAARSSRADASLQSMYIGVTDGAAPSEDTYMEPAAVVREFRAAQMSRSEAERTLRSTGMKEGTFVIRPSSSNAGCFAITFVHDGRILHLPIDRCREPYQSMWTLVSRGPGRRFNDVDSLIQFYATNAYVRGEVLLLCSAIHAS
eukprot:m.62405 g.62405  ORF g.62405 m.62405 type:complete len:209 (+) comp11908_c0_seq4:314-940(+)